MGPPKCRPRAKSTGSQIKREMVLQEHGNRGVYLPNSAGIYVSKNKSGDPVFVRKKRASLLEGRGSNMRERLISYRADVNLQVRRRKSFCSQNSGRATSLSSRLSTISHSEPGKHCQSCKCRNSPMGFNQPNHQSASTSPVCSHHSTCSPHSNACRNEVPQAQSQSFNPYPPAQFMSAPPAQPPPPHPSNLGTQPLSNGGYSLPNSPTDPQGFATQLPMSGSIPYWGPQSSAFIGPRSASMPVYPSQHQPAAPYPEVRSPTYYTIPGPVPTPMYLSPATPLPVPANRPHFDGTTAVNSPITYSPNEVKKCEEHYKEVLAAKAAEEKKAKREKEIKKRQDLGKHLQHIHTCASCGNVRSRGYQEAHPLKRGQIPERDYCGRCLRWGAPDKNGNLDQSPISERAKDSPVPAASPVKPRGILRGKIHPKLRFGGKWMKKPRRFSEVSNTITDSSAPDESTISLPSETSEGESDVTVIPPAPYLKKRDCSRRVVTSPAKISHKTDENIRPSDINSPRRRRAARNHGKKNKDAKNGVHTEGLGSMASHKQDKRTETLPIPEPNNPSASLDDGIDAPSEGTAHGKRSRNSRSTAPNPPPKIIPKKVTVESVSDLSGTGNFGVHEETYQVLDGNQDRLDLYSDAWGIPEPSRPRDHHDGFRSKQPARGSRDSDKENQPIQKSKQKVRINDQHQVHLPSMSESEQPERDLDLNRRARHNQRRAGRPQNDTQQRHQDRWGVGGTYMEPMPDVRSDRSHNPRSAFEWDIPPTPTDQLFGDVASDPHVMYDIGQEELDQAAGEAEGWVEDDLAEASKLFDEFVTPSGRRCTRPSAFNFSNLTATRTEVSVGSYDSHEEYADTDGAILYELAASSIDDDRIGNEENLVKSLEFSSIDDMDHKVRSDDRAVSSRRYSSKQPQGSKSESVEKKRKKATRRSNGNGLDSSLVPSPPDAVSSMVAHTGHSMEDDMIDNDEPTDSGRRRRVRRPRPL